MHQRKDEFLAMLGHELRNPLAPVRNALTLLLERAEELPQAVLGNVRIADRQMAHMTRLVDELLDVARITQGRIELRREKLAVSEVVTAATNGARPSLDARGLRFAYEPGSEQAFVYGDETRLVQVVSNLLHNAAKFTPEGGSVSLTVEASADLVEIRVTDSGVGIAPEEQERLFALFYRKQGDSEGGLGLGLALVRQIVELHGGTVACESKGSGQGSTFFVRLPRVAPPGDTARPSPLNGSPKRALRVLVVDDNHDAASTLGDLLEALGHGVALAHTGEAALDMLGEERFDVVLLDIGLPDRDGYSVARAVHEMPGETPLLVALTGYGDSTATRHSREAGMTHHLLKPVDLAKLRAIFDSVPGPGVSAPH
jgi:CheY-like chemotaxis protein